MTESNEECPMIGFSFFTFSIPHFIYQFLNSCIHPFFLFSLRRLIHIHIRFSSRLRSTNSRWAKHWFVPEPSRGVRWITNEEWSM